MQSKKMYHLHKGKFYFPILSWNDLMKYWNWEFGQAMKTVNKLWLCPLNRGLLPVGHVGQQLLTSSHACFNTFLIDRISKFWLFLPSFWWSKIAHFNNSTKEILYMINSKYWCMNCCSNINLQISKSNILLLSLSFLSSKINFYNARFCYL